MDKNQEIFSQIHNWFKISERLLLVLGVAIIAIYLLRLLAIRNPKRKFDYINKHEIRSLKNGVFFIVISLMFFLDDLLSLQFERQLISTNWDIIELSPFIGGFFVVFILSVLIYSGIKSILNIYYPKFLGKRLDKIRYNPRISSTTGNQMELLNEDEEDVYLTEKMQADEQALRYDYDVWLDRESGDVHIEKYDMHESAIICPECRFRTLKDVNDNLITITNGEEEYIQRDYECSYCGHEESKKYKVVSNIAKNEIGGASQLESLA